jgi:hypothetical protein
VLLRLAVAAALALVAAGCGGGTEAPQAQEQQQRSQLPPGCEVPVIERTVAGFLTAVTAGRGVARYLAPPDDFQGLGYAEPDRRFTTTGRAKALAFLARRHRFAENVRLLQLVVSPGGDANHVGVRFVLVRTAADLLQRGIHTRAASGDGIVNCVSRRLSLWRLAASGG